MSNLPISKDTFVEADDHQFRELLYDTFDYMVGKEIRQVEKCNSRFNKIEKRNFIEKAALAVIGAVLSFFAWFKQ